MRVPVDCGNFNAGDGQSKEKTIPCNRTPGEDRKLARNGGGQATRTHVKFVACFDYGISLVGLFSWGLSLGREGSRTKPGTLSPSLSRVLILFQRNRAERVRHFPKYSKNLTTERKTNFLVVRFTMLFSLLNITNSSMVLCVWISFFTSYFRFVFFIICLFGFTYYKKILQ